MERIRIAEASGSADFLAFGDLCRQYVDWCRIRYKDTPWFIDEVFGYQALDEELELLSKKYAPPLGKTLLVMQGGEVIGGGAYRRVSVTVCEMKRVYIIDRAKGQGLGRRLIEALLENAEAEGFATMQLDTGSRMTEAIALYTQMGFVRCEPFHDYPEKLMQYLIFMQKDFGP